MGAHIIKMSEPRCVDGVGFTQQFHDRDYGRDMSLHYRHQTASTPESRRPFA